MNITVVVKDFGHNDFCSVTVGIPPITALCLGIFQGDERKRLAEQFEAAAKELVKVIDA